MVPGRGRFAFQQLRHHQPRRIHRCGFFLAGNEFYRLLTEGVDRTATGVSNNHLSTTAGVTKSAACRLLLFSSVNGRISVPAATRSFEVYSMRGQLLYRQAVEVTNSEQTVTLPEAVQHAPAIAVRFTGLWSRLPKRNVIAAASRSVAAEKAPTFKRGLFILATPYTGFT